MDWMQWISLLGSLGAFAYWIHQETNKKIDEIRQDVKQQSARTDRLYEMFVDLLKERRN